MNFKHYVIQWCLGMAVCFGVIPQAFAWWDCAWTKRSILQINNTTGASQSNAIIELLLTATELPGYPFPVTTPTDIRVVDSDDATEMNYYLEPYTSAQSQIRIYVQIPTFAVGTKNIYVYYSNAAATSYSAKHSPSLFSTASTGVRLSTRSSSSDPSSQADFFTAWRAAPSATAGYGCSILPDYTNRSNASVFGTNSNILYTMTTVLDVPAAQAGSWGIRLGGDYGRGGAIYADGVVVAQNWTSNLWWANSWTNATVLSGTVNLTAGKHIIVTYGAEDCCDGLAAIQLDPPGTTSWTDLNTANFTLNTPSCAASQAPIKQAESGVVKVFKTSRVVSDPLNGTTNPKAIPGAKERYSIVIQNTGGSNFVDSGAIQITDAIPSNVNMLVTDINGAGSGPVRFVNSAPASGLSYTFSSLGSTTDDVQFSNSGTTTFAYTPVAGGDGTDANVKGLLINPKGTFTCGVTSSPNSATFEFDVIVK